MNKLRIWLSIVLLASSALITSVKAGAIVDADPADGYIAAGTVDLGTYDHSYTFTIGNLWNTDHSTAVEGFILPYLAPGQTVTNASVSVYLQTKGGTPNFNLQLYGLKRVSTVNGHPVAADAYTGTNDANNTLLAPKFITPTTAVGQEVTYSGANVGAFVQSQYANAAFSGMDLAANRYIFFRLSADATQSGWNNYVITNGRNPIRDFHPELALTIGNGITNVAGRLQFSFSLPQDSITSAGVYDTSSGKLLRTLWNNVKYQQGTNYGVWDGKDDNGTALATGSNYQIKLIYHNVKYIFQGMIGNTSSSQSGPNLYHSYGKIHDLAVSGNSVFFSVAYNEALSPFHYFPVGSPQAPSDVVANDWTDSASCFFFVAADASRSYWAKVYGGMNGSDTYIIAIDKTTNSFYTFPRGSAPTGSGQLYTSCVDFDGTANQPNPATGLAVQQSGSYLFVAHGSLNLVRVFDKVQGNLIGSFSVPHPTRMATTANGDVWVVSAGTTPVVNRYTFANGTATLVRSITGLSFPVGVGVSSDDTTVLVADGGTSQQIKAFTNSTGAAKFTYGNAGGMITNGSAITPQTFQFAAQRANVNEFSLESAIVFQADNTVWIADGGNSRVVHYSLNGNGLVYIEQITFNDTSYRATVDMVDTTRVFNGFLEYAVDYSKPLGGTNGSWSFTRNWAFGLPNDSGHLYYGYMNGFINVATLSNGRTYGFLTNFVTNQWDLFELPATGNARYTGYTFGTFPRIYEDGTLRYNQTAGDFSSVRFYSQPLTGFDNQNNPVWGSPALLASTPLATGDPVPWAAYPMRTEITASGVVVDFDGYPHTGFHIGGVAKGGSAFQWKAGPSVNGTVNGWFPQDGHFDIGDGVEYPGNHVMAMGRNIVYGYHGEFFKGGEACQWVNYLDNGLMVGLFGTFSSSAIISNNAVDGVAGNAFSPTLVRGTDGNVYLYHNDECNHGGTDRWLITGWDGIAEINAVGAVGGTTSTSADTQGPVVSITSPSSGASYLNGSSISLGASAAGTGSNLTSVQFFDGTTSLGIITVAPYTLDYSGLSAGTHTITAKATDATGAVTTSAPVTITISSDGVNAPPPAPISLGTGSVTSGSVSLHWTQPSIGTTSSTTGQIISFQASPPNSPNALPNSAVAGAPGYSVSNFNLLGNLTNSGLTYTNVLNSLGQTVPNLGLWLAMQGTSDTWSLQSLTGTAKLLFADQVTTVYNTAVAITIANIPYASYDVVVYSQPDGLKDLLTHTTSVSVGDGANLKGTVSQSLNKLPTGYAVATVAAGVSTSTTNINTIVFQGLTSPILEIQGPTISAFQIVQRPYDQGVPTSYSIERATGTSGTFASVGTVSGSTLSYTDSTADDGTAYQYRVKAINSYGSSYSNVINVSTPNASTASTGTPATFAAWKSLYFSAAELADATISGPGADPYGSSVPNLLAYALQLNPATVKPSDVPQPVIQDGHLTVTYFVPKVITDVTFVVEVSTNLATWNTGTNYTQVLSSVPIATGTTITVQDTLPSTTTKHFMRLRVLQK